MNINSFFYTTKCPKQFKPNKFERPQAEDQVWWSNQFKELEAGIKVPAYRKLSELRKVFSDEELYNLTIAGLEYEDDVHDAKTRRRARPYHKIKRKKLQLSLITDQKRKSDAPTKRYSVKKTLFVDKVIEFCQKPQNEVGCWTTKRRSLLPLIPCIDKAEQVELMLAENFETFFNQTKSNLPQKGLETVFTKKARIVEKQLAANFEEYFNNIETITPITIDKETILSVFEINNSLPISISIFINIQELRSVSENIALYLGNAALGTPYVLQHEINSDLIHAYSKPMIHAFGTMLPVRLRRFKNSSSEAIKWIKKEIKHENLRTFAAVFEGILELETSKNFILWLRSHREIDPPEYLLNKCFQMKTSKKFAFYRHSAIRSYLTRCSQGSMDSGKSYLGIMV